MLACLDAQEGFRIPLGLGDLDSMEINRAFSVDVERAVSDEALRQALEYTTAAPFRFSCRTSCCKKFRQNSNLVDPGYYLNGGPSCQQLGLTCESPDEHEMDAIADGLVPGSLVYAPKTENQFWPAIVDFSPDEDSHFVIFRIGGPLCCTPYAYYLSFIPDWSDEIYGGWFTADHIVPFETLVRKPVKLNVNFNDPHFDSAYETANTYYAEDLKHRLDRFSLVCRTLSKKSRRVRFLQSPNKSIKGKVALQAQKFSRELARRLVPITYQRVDGGENLSLASSSSSSSDQGAIGLAGMIKKKLSLTPQAYVKGFRERDGEFSFLTMGDLAHEQDHFHPSQIDSPRRRDKPGDASESSGFVNPTEHAKMASHEVYKRSAIQAIIRSGLHEIRTYRTGE